VLAWCWRTLVRRERGFTFIELAVVLLILAILALLLSRYLAVRKRGYKAERRDILREAGPAQRTYAPHRLALPSGSVSPAHLSSPHPPAGAAIIAPE
jgi:prepilin-type N-terminal cleavage/methylation domain-containing protein